MKEIVVAGTKIDSILFSLIGAKTIEIKSKQELSILATYAESNFDKIAGIVLAAKFFDTESKSYSKIEKLGIPMIMLPDPKGELVDTTLETLQEKTIGMKLKN